MIIMPLSSSGIGSAIAAEHHYGPAQFLEVGRRFDIPVIYVYLYSLWADYVDSIVFPLLFCLLPGIIWRQLFVWGGLNVSAAESSLEAVSKVKLSDLAGCCCHRAVIIGLFPKRGLYCDILNMLMVLCTHYVFLR